MWKRDEAVKPVTGPQSGVQGATPVPAGLRNEGSLSMEKDIANIGKSVVIKIGRAHV